MGSFFTNPLIVKEMRERFRTKKTVWILGLYLLVMGAILLGFMYVSKLGGIRVPGESREVFYLIAIIQYAMICFIAPALSAGAISGEREKQTLNILLTTQLTPGRIIVSKLLTSLAFIFLLIVSSLPLYSFVFLSGGISPTQLLTLFCFFAVNILFFGSLGLFCSTWIKRTGVSTITAYGLALFVVVGTGLLFLFIGMLLHEMYPDAFMGDEVFALPALKVLGALNPVMVMFDTLGEPLGPSINFFMPQWLFFTIVYSLISFLIVAWSAYLLRPIRRTWLRWKK
ncbi:ABC transporter permease [Brevibacillus ginsengisoli]|uniref:ABC transporter permease n=1 Tax=Brevibacillus ginsengisoli TaxID=363854 RepID=UPI003CF68434